MHLVSDTVFPRASSNGLSLPSIRMFLHLTLGNPPFFQGIISGKYIKLSLDTYMRHCITLNDTSITVIVLSDPADMCIYRL